MNNNFSIYMDRLNYLENLEQGENLLNKNKELIKLFLSANIKNMKRWDEIFFDFKSLDELKNYYENQKKTFGVKKKSPTASFYFYNFILSFLRFYPNYDKRSLEIISILLRNLKSVDNELYSYLINNLSYNFRQKILKEEYKGINWAYFFENISSLDELFDIFEKHKLAFHHKDNSVEVIKSYYLPFIETFLKFYSYELDKLERRKIYEALLLLEHRIRKIDEKFQLESLILNKIDYKEFVETSVKSRTSYKRWAEFFSYLNLDDLNNFYKKNLTRFGRRAKQQDKNFFKSFIEAYSKYDINLVYNKLLILIDYLKKIDSSWEDYLSSLGLSYSSLVEKSKFDSLGKEKDSYEYIIDNIKTLEELVEFIRRKKYIVKYVKDKDKALGYINLILKKFEEFKGHDISIKNIKYVLLTLEKNAKLIEPDFQLSKDLLLYYTLAEKENNVDYESLKKKYEQLKAKYYKLEKNFLKQSEKMKKITEENKKLKKEFSKHKKVLNNKKRKRSKEQKEIENNKLPGKLNDIDMIFTLLSNCRNLSGYLHSNNR